MAVTRSGATSVTLRDTWVPAVPAAANTDRATTTNIAPAAVSAMTGRRTIEEMGKGVSPPYSLCVHTGPARSDGPAHGVVRVV